MAYDLGNRLPSDQKYFRFCDPGAYQYDNSSKCKPSKAPFNSSKPRATQTAIKLWTHALYNGSVPQKIRNSTAMLSKIPRFPYEVLSKEDLEALLCRCGFQNLCECPPEEQEEELISCHAKVPRIIYKGAAPPALFGNGLSTPSKGDRGFQILADGTTERIKGKITDESPPFYNAAVNEFTKYYQGCKWSKRTSLRSIKTIEACPGPADYDILKKAPSKFELCAENFRSYKRKTSKQLRFIEMVQQRNILQNLPGPASYNVQFPRFSELQYLGPKAKRFNGKNNHETAGPAEYWLRRDFDLPEIPNYPCRAKLSERACFGVKDTRFKPVKEIGPGPATYCTNYKPCHFMKCSRAPFGNSAIRFKEKKSCEHEEKIINNEMENHKNPCIFPTWQLKSRTIRFEKLNKNLNEPSPADFSQSNLKRERCRQSQYIAPFFASECRFQAWFDWMAVSSNVKTPGPCLYKLEIPQCNPAVPYGPLSRASRFPSYDREIPAPNKYNVGGGIETILATHNQRLKKNIENQHKFIWEPPVEPEELSFEAKITLLLNKSIALLEVGDASQEEESKPISKKSSDRLKERNNLKKVLRSVVRGQKVVNYY